MWASQTAVKLDHACVLYQGMASAVPQTPQTQRGLQPPRQAFRQSPAKSLLFRRSFIHAQSPRRVAGISTPAKNGHKNLETSCTRRSRAQIQSFKFDRSTSQPDL